MDWNGREQLARLAHHHEEQLSHIEPLKQIAGR